ncbi:hypothetical protein MTP99_019748 [Tenebrio molitor]|nr:hypothetical protein MTP99_019748 [Tenebrio molitor]
MAFADDLVMLSDSDVEAPLMLKEVETFLRERGMGVNPAKCRALCTGVIAGRAVGRTVSTYRINNLPIPAVGHMDTFRYLGHSYGYDGVGKPSLFNLTVWLENVRRAPLKPDQKLLMIKSEDELDILQPNVVEQAVPHAVNRPGTGGSSI